LGKVLAKQILSEWSDEAKGKHDPSTDALMKKCQMHR
jgi:hypothetical protein